MTIRQVVVFRSFGEQSLAVRFERSHSVGTAVVLTQSFLRGSNKLVCSKIEIAAASGKGSGRLQGFRVVDFDSNPPFGASDCLTNRQ